MPWLPSETLIEWLKRFINMANHSITARVGSISKGEFEAAMRQMQGGAWTAVRVEDDDGPGFTRAAVRVGAVHRTNLPAVLRGERLPARRAPTGPCRRRPGGGGLRPSRCTEARSAARRADGPDVRGASERMCTSPSRSCSRSVATAPATHTLYEERHVFVHKDFSFELTRAGSEGPPRGHVRGRVQVQGRDQVPLRERPAEEERDAAAWAGTTPTRCC